MNNIIAHSTSKVLAPVLAGRKLFYHVFYHSWFPPAGDLLASGLSEEVTP
jgi:hypothetical protein